MRITWLHETRRTISEKSRRESTRASTSGQKKKEGEKKKEANKSDEKSNKGWYDHIAKIW